MSEENQSENPDIEVTTNSGEIVLDDPHGHIEQVDLQTEMQRSYLDYAMAVIIGRALPDVRDGLKPVHRRVIYAMYDGGYRPDRVFNKCARVVGDVTIISRIFFAAQLLETAIREVKLNYLNY